MASNKINEEERQEILALLAWFGVKVPQPTDFQRYTLHLWRKMAWRARLAVAVNQTGVATFWHKAARGAALALDRR